MKLAFKGSNQQHILMDAIIGMTLWKVQSLLHSSSNMDTIPYSAPTFQDKSSCEVHHLMSFD